MDASLFHYTSLETLFNIFENIKEKCITLRAGYFMNMNDPYDCRYFFKEVSEILYQKTSQSQENIENILKESMYKVGIPYFISFSDKRDSLPMWSLYGKGGHGVSIGFSRDALIKAVDNYQNIGDIHQRALAKMCFCHLYECRYWKRKDIQKNFIDQYNVRMNVFGKMEGLNDKEVCLLSYLIKNPDYRFEKESRIIFMLTPNQRLEYLKLYIPLNAIQRIICGPCIDKELVKAITPPDLHQCIVESKIPYTDTPQQTTPY